jgi:hypothetical protein
MFRDGAVNARITPGSVGSNIDEVFILSMDSKQVPCLSYQRNLILGANIPNQATNALKNIDRREMVCGCKRTIQGPNVRPESLEQRPPQVHSCRPLPQARCKML